ncbi:MAG: leucine-rich repeat domain-containing protein [Gammaproteobacteria bacterium]|nr:leucine-rich repeat domain-containing protein [Gammaproteobacteria bacterium]
MNNSRNQIANIRSKTRKLVAAALLISISACSQNYTVSVNNQAVFDPTGRLFNGELVDPDLQGCVNIAMQQQNTQNAEMLRVLSCGSSEVETVDAIEQLSQLRFLDLGNNFIRDLSPLHSLRLLGGLNLMNNEITDISPLLNMTNLASVNLVGNNNIPCQQLLTLENRLGSKLSRPESCRN